MTRRKSKYLNSTAALKAENAELRIALSLAKTPKEPSPEEMDIIDANFNAAWRQRIRLQRAKEEEAKREALLKMTHFAP